MPASSDSRSDAAAGEAAAAGATQIVGVGSVTVTDASGRSSAKAAGSPRAPSAADPQVGRSIGPYRLIEKLGEGGMGSVWKATHARLDKAVALKLLPPQLLAHPEVVARFEREMKAAGRVAHPHVVQAFDAGEAGGVHYLAMEYVQGSDLHRVVADRGPLSVKQACRAVRQAALGLAAAHAQGLVHRDVKPQNLLLSKEGKVKLLDLGLARLAEQAASEATAAGLTAAGQVMGTPDYMAPEQWEDTHAAGEAADLYALGCTLYFLLTGKPPFGSDRHSTIARKMHAHLAEPAPSLRSARPDVPLELDVLCNRLLAKEPKGRPASAADVATALAPFANPTSDSRPGTTVKSKAADVEFPVFDLAPVTIPGARTKTAAATGDAPPSNRKRVLLAAAGGLFGVGLLGVIFALTLDLGDATLRIESFDPDVQVTVKQGGKRVVILDPKSNASADLDPGTYELTLKGGSAGGFAAKLAANSITLSRGDVKVVEVLKVPKALGTSPFAPLDQAWTERVASLPPEAQVKEVLAELARRNPGFETSIVPFEQLPAAAQRSGAYEKHQNYRTADGKLTVLSLVSNAVNDLTPVASIPTLSALTLHSPTPDSPLTDLRPLAGLRLTQLSLCNHGRLRDLSPLAGMEIVILECCRCPLDDLTPLKGLPLKHLDVSNTPLSSLDSIAGASLRYLNIAGSRVSDGSLGRLENIGGLRSAHLKGAPVRDLAFLRRTSVIELSADDAVLAANRAVLSDLPKLKTINGEPAEQFWKEFDADPVRAAVLRVFDLGGRIRLKVAGAKQTVRTAAELPGGTLAPDAVADITLEELPFDQKILERLRPMEPEGLDLQRSKVDDADLAAIRDSFPALAWLNLFNTEVTDAGLAHLAGWKTLRYLDLNTTRVTDAGIPSLRGLPLTRLVLASTRVTDDGLATVRAAVPGVTELMIDGTPITDAGVKHLEGWEALSELNLARTAVTDAGLGTLRGLTGLKTLDVSETNVTAAGVASFRAARPDCKVAWTGPSADAGRAAVLRVFEMGGYVHLKGRAARLSTAADLPGGPIAPDGLDIIAVSDRPFDASKLYRLRPLNPRSLNLAGTTVTDADLAAIRATFSSLEDLSLYKTHVMDAGLQDLEGWSTLRSLDLYSTDVTDIGVASLRGLPLTSLIVANNPITDEGLAAIREAVPGLTKLGINRTAVTDGGLKRLEGWESLTSLNLSNTAVTDAGIEALRGVPQLKSLALNGSLVTAAGVAAFRAARPDCEVAWIEAPADVDPGRQAVLRVYQTGGWISRWNRQVRLFADLPDGPLPPGALTEVHLTDLPVDGSVLARLAPLVPRGLNLTGTNFSDEDLAEVRKTFPDLNSLLLYKTRITDTGLKHLEGWGALRYLDLNTTRVTDAGVTSLRGLKLTKLILANTKLSDEGLGAVREAVPGLSDLVINGTAVTDAGLKRLEGWDSLTSLTVFRTAVGDAGLGTLRTLPKLKTLDVSVTKVTPEGVAAFRTARPDCQVTWQAP